MSAYLIDWLSLAGRWIHLVTGIAWIGSSFYFVWLDNHLSRPANPGDAARGVGGELWSVHGGGFYHAQKYKVAPEELPGTLHWFYWEAYSTLLSGLFLLGLIYYGQAAIFLVDPRVASLSVPAAIATGIAFIIGGWVVYDALCRSPLAKNGVALAAVLAVLLAAAAWGLCHLFSGRAAFIHFGAMLGTIMVANVFFVIIPGQRRTVQALREGLAPDPELGQRGKLRSVHNTYFTLPVLFTMISNHYAATYGARWNWLVLVALCAAGALLRAWFVARHFARQRGGRTPAWTAVAGILILAGTVAALAPTGSRVGAQAAAATIAAVPAPGMDSSPAGTTDSAQGPGATGFERIAVILEQRCNTCHAAKPAHPAFTTTPKGVVLETYDQVRSMLPLLETQVASRVMPLGNLTGMTDDERTELIGWIHAGAPR
mgnify:CR=1 FL=1